MLASPGGTLESSYDVVVVGSGYGGAIAASRFARAGRSVCVLERGVEHRVGDFPESLWQAVRSAQVRTRKRHFGSSTALFDVRLDDEVNVLVGCGVGGTSLINANVALRPRAEVLADPRWPEALRRPGALDAYFARAEEWLGSNPYPDDAPRLAKVDALNAVASSFGAAMQRAPINVSFDDAPNPAGIRQPPCSGCGNCVTGCNVGAKNTVAMNYLPDAVRHGARIFTKRLVRSVEPSAAGDGRWEVHFESVGSRRRLFGAGDEFVTADIVILAAGTLGSTEIMLRSRGAGLSVSDAVGRRFSGNGDVLGFGYGADRKVNGFGWAKGEEGEEVGPTIVGMVPVSRPGPIPGAGLTIEEGAIPGALKGVMPLALLGCALIGSNASLWQRIRMVFGRWRAAAERTLTFLVMSDDAADGNLVLEDDRIVVDWPGARTDVRIRENNELLDRISGSIGAEYAPEPLWTAAAGHELVSVHPLGGCVMADDASAGVVNDLGGVFAGPAGSIVHPGLHVLDGSVLPRPVDTNPSLTISALTERAVEAIIVDRGWSLDLTPNDKGEPPNKTTGLRAPGIVFTERMAGWCRFGDTRSDVSFVVTIEIPDMAGLERDPGQVQSMSGTVEVPRLSAEPLAISDGEFRLMQQRRDRAEEWNMSYRMRLRSVEGKTYRFEGSKVIRTGSLLRGWKDTTTLFVTLTADRVDGGDGDPIAEGVLRISKRDLIRQLSTIETTSPASVRGWRTKYRFARAFKGRFLPIYGGVLEESSRLSHRPSGLLRPLRLPPPEICWYSPATGWHELEGDALEQAQLTASDLVVGHGSGPILDGVGKDAELMLTHFPRSTGSDQPTRGPVMLAAGFSMRANSLAHPTTETTLAEALAEAGFDVWLFDYRASIALPSSLVDFTIDDIATIDWPVGVAEVRRRTGAESVQVVGHCVGSVSILMALLAGLDGVRSAVCSQFALHPHTSALNRLKNATRIVDIFDALGIEGLAPNTGRGPTDRLIDLAAGLLPIPKGEACQQPVCRWLNGVFGLTHTHDQLNQATHASFTTAFGNGDITPLRQLAEMTRAKKAVDHNGDDVYLANVERLRLPLLFVQGSKNYIFKPKGTAKTLEWLAEHNDPDLYELLTLDDYAHLDGLVGRNAHVDVFPHIVDHLRRH